MSQRRSRSTETQFEISKGNRFSPKATWLLSMSDLFTLLLAIMLVGARMIPSSSRGEAQVKGGNPPQVGIPIATPEEKSREESVFLTDDDFSNKGSGSFAQQSNGLKALTKLLRSLPRQVTIKSCSREFSGREGMAWHSSMTKAMTVHRHVIDTIDTRNLRVAILGPNCDGLRLDTEIENVTTRIDFEWSSSDGG